MRLCGTGDHFTVDSHPTFSRNPIDVWLRWLCVASSAVEGGIEVLVFMLSLNCQADFDGSFWGDFDAALAEEWGIYAATDCRQIDGSGGMPSTFHEYSSMADDIRLLLAAGSNNDDGGSGSYTATATAGQGSNRCRCGRS